MEEADSLDRLLNMPFYCRWPQGADSSDMDVGEEILEGGALAASLDRGHDRGAANKDDQGDMTFYCANYPKDAMKMMLMMRSHHMLTDVVLEVEQELFHCHRIILSAASPYFKAMFTGGLRESEMSRIKLQGVCPTAMARIIYFMYTGHVRVTEVTVCQLLPAATMFQVPSVIEACCVFLERQLDPTNAIGIANFADQHGCHTLRQKANQFIERHFVQICQEEEFLQLSAFQLIALIRRDELNVQNEKEVYNAVLAWVRYDEDNRYPKMEHILSAVRCQLLTPNFIHTQVTQCDVLRKVPACREYLARIFKELTLHKRPVVKERTPNTTRMIFVAGGYFRHSLDVMEAFNVDDKQWVTLPKLTVPRSGLGGAFLRGTFYAVGGRNTSPGNSYDSDWVDRYNPVTETWRPCAPMSVPRNRVGVAVMDELLYAVGGSTGAELHKTVEYYNPDDDRWTVVQSMNQKRLGLGVAVVNRLLYVFGGYDGTDRLSSVECYHPENNAWTTVAPMQLPKSGAGVAALNQYIYVAGGFDGQRQLATVERYNTETNEWTQVAPIRIARSALTLTTLDCKLYAMGGFDGHDFLTIVEVYDPVRDVWEEGVPLTSGRSGHAAGVTYHPGASKVDCFEAACTDKSGKRRGDNYDDSSPGPSGGGPGSRCQRIITLSSRATDDLPSEQFDQSELNIVIDDIPGGSGSGGGNGLLPDDATQMETNYVSFLDQAMIFNAVNPEPPFSASCSSSFSSAQSPPFASSPTRSLSSCSSNLSRPFKVKQYYCGLNPKAKWQHFKCRAAVSGINAYVSEANPLDFRNRNYCRNCSTSSAQPSGSDPGGGGSSSGLPTPGTCQGGWGCRNNPVAMIKKAFAGWMGAPPSPSGSGGSAAGTSSTGTTGAGATEPVGNGAVICADNETDFEMANPCGSQ